MGIAAAMVHSKGLRMDGRCAANRDNLSLGALRHRNDFSAHDFPLTLF
jgi:hypothetical protein